MVKRDFFNWESHYGIYIVQDACFKRLVTSQTNNYIEYTKVGYGYKSIQIILDMFNKSVIPNDQKCTS